jgi:hypothetical protein
LVHQVPSCRRTTTWCWWRRLPTSTVSASRSAWCTPKAPARAKGFFEVTQDISRLTRADFLGALGVQTPVIDRALLHNDPRARQPPDAAGPARIRRQVLHPGGQQLPRLLHPRRHEVPGHGARAQAQPQDAHPAELAPSPPATTPSGSSTSRPYGPGPRGALRL